MGGTWLLVATLALLVVVALAAAVGSAAWIARSGDEAREIEDRGMLIMAFAEHRALFADAASRTAEAIAELGPDAAGPVEQRIAAIAWRPRRVALLRHRSPFCCATTRRSSPPIPRDAEGEGPTIDPRHREPHSHHQGRQLRACGPSCAG